MILINDHLIEVLDSVKDPNQNRFPIISAILENLQDVTVQKQEVLFDKVCLELFRFSWNSVNKTIRLGSFSYNEKTKLYDAEAIRTIKSTKNNVLEHLYIIQADSHELIFTFKCSEIAARKRSRPNYTCKDVNLSSREKQFGIDLIKSAIRNAETKFLLDFPSSLSKNKDKELEMKEKIEFALWNVLYSMGLSSYGSIEINHIKSLYNKAMLCFIDYGKVQEKNRFLIFCKAYDRAKCSKIADYQALYYELIKNKLDIHVKIKKEQMWTKVAEKRSRSISDKLVFSNQSTLKKLTYEDIQNIVFVIYTRNGVIESFGIYDLWSLLKVE